MKQSFKRMRLVDHLWYCPNSFKIGAIRSYSVNTNISNKEHTPFAFTNSFGSKQPCQHVNLRFPYGTPPVIQFSALRLPIISIQAQAS
jgi:hypothetical protein